MAATLAVVQTAIRKALEQNTRRFEKFLNEAAELGVDLVCFPEMSLTGYGTSILSMADLRERVDRALDRLQQRGTELGVGVIVGHAHRDGYALLNRATVLLSDGARFSYDKIHLTESETEYFRAGDTPLCFAFGDLKVGVIVCRDQNDPQLAAAAKEQGADALFILAAHYYEPKMARWKVEKNRALPIARAVENGMHVLVSNTIGTHLGGVSLGNSLIADPDGCLVVSAGEDEEALLSVVLG